MKIANDWKEVPIDDWKEVPLESGPEMPTKPIDSPSAGMSFLGGVTRGASLGFQDEASGIAGGIGRAANYLTGPSQDTGIVDAFKRGYVSDRDAERYIAEKQRQTNPGSSLAGEIVSGLPAIGARGAVGIGSLVGQGAATGFGNAEGSIQDQATSTAIGGGVGGALGVAADKLPKLAKNLKTELGLKGLGANKAAVKALGDRDSAVVQKAIDTGVMNPLRTTEGQLATNEMALNKANQNLNLAREGLGSVKTRDVLDEISKQSSNLTDSSLDEAIVSQISRLKNDLSRLGSEDIPLADLINMKSKIGERSRNTFGDLTKNKEGMDIVRKSLRNVEIKEAEKLAPEYRGILEDSSTNYNIKNILENKLDTQKANSLISLGGMIGGGTAVAAANPIGAIAGALMTKTGRDRAARTGAISIDQVQKLAKALGITPQQAASFLTKGAQSGE